MCCVVVQGGQGGRNDERYISSMRGRLEGAKDTFENNTAILKRAEVSCKFCYDGTDIMMGQDKKGTGRDGTLL